MDNILMKCGHAANSKQIMPDGSKIPACAICDCNEIAKQLPNLTGRKAICTGHKSGNPKPVDSSFSLPFFEYRSDQKYDAYYCGCWGWD